MNVEEDYLDVLQNIEFAIVGVYRQQSALLDFDVEQAINALIKVYQAQNQNRTPVEPRLNEVAALVYHQAKAVCDWRLGHAAIVDGNSGQPIAAPAIISFDIMLACLKRIRKSIQHWNKQGGRRGYLTFVQEFVPG